jgi:hypothetical protein
MSKRDKYSKVLAALTAEARRGAERKARVTAPARPAPVARARIANGSRLPVRA